MASTYSTNLALELIGTGDQSGVWGLTTNSNLGTLIEQAISGYATQAMADADQTITIPNGATGVARNMFIECTGALTAARSLIVPVNRKLYFVFNNTTGGFAITVKVTGLTGISVPNGKKMVLVSNGTDVVDATSHMSSLTLASALAVTSGGTGVTTSTGSGANVLGTSPTITTAVLNGTITGTSQATANTASTLVMRDASGNFAATTITANLTGNASGTSGSTTGNALTATTLQTARAINGTNFDGSAAITVTAAGSTLTGTVVGSSTSTSLNSTILASSLTSIGTITTGVWNGTDVAVADGGTGASTLAANNVLLGNGTSALQVVAPSTSGNVLTSNGTTWTSAAIAGSVSSFSAGSTGFTPSTGTTGAVTLAGTLAVANGGTGVTVATTTFDAVGSVVMALCVTASSVAIGDTSVGSALRYNFTRNSQSLLNDSDFAVARSRLGSTTYDGAGSSLSGTWRKLSNGLSFKDDGGDGLWYLALWVRVS